MRKATLILFVMLALAASAAAQNKVSGALQCGKAEKEYTIDIGDHPGHAFAISQGKCAWKAEIGGIQDKEATTTGFGEISGDTSRIRFSSVDTMANGDKIYSHGDGTIALNKGVPQTEEGKWSISGGTGMFKGLKGNGTDKGKYAADGTFTGEAEIEYTLPAAKK